MEKLETETNYAQKKKPVKAEALSGICKKKNQRVN